jgi:hypothetical protein
MRTMGSGLAVALALLACAAPAAARHGAVVVDARQATPGVQLTAVERPSTATNVTYRLAAAGVPRGVLFGIWVKDFGQPFQQVAWGFRLTEAGSLETIDDAGRPRRLDEVVLDPGPYPRGAAWEIALVSADNAVMAFAKVVPRPIAARNEACGVSLELASRSSDRFIATTQGFKPGEPVVVELSQGNGTTQKQLFVPADKRLPLEVIAHSLASLDHRARYTVKGRTCEVAVDYTWGDPVLTQDARRSVR